MFNFFKPKNKFVMRYFCTALVWHCNLNCRYCDHFSPLAKEKYFDIKKLERDFKQIAKWIDIQSIGLMGGEPLLHPNLNNILVMARKIFPRTNLIIFTNGILLDKMKEDFWRVCGKNHIGIGITKYNVKRNEQLIFQNARNHAVRIGWETDKDGGYKTMYKPALDLSGSQDIIEMHKVCWHNKGGCTYFEDGKFYKCSIAGNIIHFNNYFKENLKLTKKDYLNIYKVRNTKQIEDYFNNPIDFCKYCNVKAETANLPFEISKREKSDWCID